MIYRKPALPLCVNIDVASIKEANYGIFPSSEVKCAKKSGSSHILVEAE